MAGLAYGMITNAVICCTCISDCRNGRSSMWNDRQCCIKLVVLVFQTVGMAGLACGMIAVGSCNGDVVSAILQTLLEKSEADLKDTYARFLALGLGLTYLGK